MISRFSFSTFTKNRKKQHIKSTSLTILINATLTAASLINLIFHWKGKLLHQRQVSSISKMHKKYVSVVSPSFPELYYLKAKLPGSSKFSPSFPVLRLIFLNNSHIISLTFNSFLFSQSELREQQRDDAQKMISQSTETMTFYLLTMAALFVALRNRNFFNLSFNSLSTLHILTFPAWQQNSCRI